MKLMELNSLTDEILIVKFLDGALGLVVKKANPVKIRIPRYPGKDEYRELPLFKLTFTGQGMMVENKFIQEPRGRA